MKLCSHIEKQVFELKGKLQHLRYKYGQRSYELKESRENKLSRKSLVSRFMGLKDRITDILNRMNKRMSDE